MNPYQQRVEAQRGRNPCLANLSKFLANPYPGGKPVQLRSLDFFCQNSRPEERKVDAGDVASELANKTAQPKGRELQGQILILEDLDRTIVEHLGDQLDIDPLFFASHLDSPWITLDVQTPELAVLPSRLRPERFANIHFHQTILFESSSIPSRKLLLDSNVDRKVVVLPASSRGCIGLVRRCISVYHTNTGAKWLSMTKHSYSVLIKLIVRSSDSY